MSTSHEFDLSASPEMQALLALVQSRLAVGASEAAIAQPEFERALREHMLAVERRVHVADFARLDVDVPGVIVGNERFARRALKTFGEYTTLAGKIRVERTTYRGRGGNGGETVAPLELRLGLVDGHWTLAAAETAAAFMAAVPSADAAELLKAAGTMTPSSSHLDRLPKRVSEIWEKDRAGFEATVRRAEALDLPAPDRVAFIVPSLDGIMLPMKDAPRTPGVGKRDQGPKGHREVGCATVSLYDAKGERLHTLKFGRMPEKHKSTLHQELQEEVRTMCALYPNAELGAVADGANENWRILGEIAKELGRPMVVILDYFHAVEHLSEGLEAAGATTDEQTELRRILRDDPNGTERIIEELGARYCETGKPTVERVMNYFVNNSERTDYAALQAANRPIGSGVQEAACKSLVADRMKQSGMSWLQHGGQAILTLRGLAQSGRLHHAWEALRPAMRQDFHIDPVLTRKSPKRQSA